MNQFKITTNLKILKYLFFLTVLLLAGCTSSSETTSEQTRPMDVLTGADQTGRYLPLLLDKDIALVVNHSSLIGNTHLVDSLLSLGLNIKTVFAPEHGFRGDADAGEQVDSGMDISTGLPIISLYGKNKKPYAEHLQGIDMVVLDIQDVGTRFYTYISTMHYVMEACAESNIPFVVLDRPNPNGDYIDGPVLEKGFESFVGMHSIPVVHGLTVGELAEMVNGEAWLSNDLKCDLTVIPVVNYSHMDKYRPPVKTSPNLPNYNSVRWYATTCFFEGTIMSEGRGTYNPFEFIGYPDRDMGEFSFTPVSIDGMSKYPKLEGQTCWGVDLRKKTPGQKIDISLIIDFYNRFKEKDKFFIDYFNTLAGTNQFRKQIESGLTEEEIRASWQVDIEAYKQLRKNYLLYPDFE